MAAENGLTHDEDRQYRMARELDELLLAVESLDTPDLKAWMQDAGYLLPTERNEMVRRSNDQLLELAALQQGRGSYPLQTS